MLEELKLEYLNKYDTVVAHAFKMFSNKQGEISLPPFMDYENFNKAQRYAMYLHRLGFLDSMYQRIIRGLV